MEKSYFTSKKALCIALRLLSVSAYFNMATVSKCLTDEEGIKADYIVQHRLSRLPLKISTVQF